jgi:hypothetical protein
MGAGAHRQARRLTREHCAINSATHGGGPAGLTAAMYLGRFRLSVAVTNSGHSRAASIPKSRNQPGFPDGIGGSDLLSAPVLRLPVYRIPSTSRFALLLLGMTVAAVTDTRCRSRHLTATTPSRHTRSQVQI